MMISERLLDVTQDCEGEYIHVTRAVPLLQPSRGKEKPSGTLRVCPEVEFVEDDDESMKTNSIFLDGYICKPPVYRKRPWGGRSPICW